MYTYIHYSVDTIVTFIVSYIMVRYAMTVMIDDNYYHLLRREYVYTYIHYSITQ